MSAAAERRVGPGLVYPGQPEPRRVKLGGREFWSTGWHVIAVIHSHCVCTNGEWIGRPAKLQPWQQRLLWRLFEVEVGADGHWVRRYRRALLGIARKNGKTELAAWLTLYFLLFDGEQSPQIFCGANSEEQADLVFGAAKLCAEHSPTLKNVTDRLADEIQAPELPNSRIQRVSYKAKTKEGLNPHAIVLDEIHEFDDAGRNLYTVLTKGTVARRQPLTLLITTAGFDKATLCGELYDYGVAVRAGQHDDPRFFFEWHEAAAGLAIDSEAAWREANPSYGVTVRAEALRDILNDPGSTKDAFRRYHLNQWTQTESSWLEAGEWDACRVAPCAFDPTLPVFVGVDASSKHDSAAIVAGQWSGATLRVKAWVWQRPARPDGKPDLDWQLPIEEVKDRLRALHLAYRVPAFGYDPALITWVARELAAEGLVMVEVPQTNGRMAPPTKALYELIRERRLAHDGDPILARHVANAIKVEVGNGAFRLAKKRRGVAQSTHFANDAAIALVIMVGQAGEPVEPKKRGPMLWLPEGMDDDE